MILVVIIIFFFTVFHHNPSFPVLGPTIIVWYETFHNQVAANGFRGRVLLVVPTLNTWTMYKTILFVCRSHIDKFIHAFHMPGYTPVTVHPLPTVQLHHISKFIKNR